ncbi:hypothetical protein HHL16_17175 [Pseudoflavitalea sp. G-6-1-2]|uniref:hypothetical protein n=1 Tax=Pseudoflavitalea sp. G-6-1-2 TaxID=2728841 RepID=UPI00146E135C|nr:hypothetical protein [Pseudoflavitalea sp. G-6-1-2]NML22618.1 hypothetical protein [Pseudoflavitalea sp. G-6-1-2]
MKLRKTCFIYLPVLFVLFTGCYKYKEVDLIENPSYMRVFNSVSIEPDIFQGTNISSFFTFLMDPQTEEKNIPVRSATMADFLGTRELYTTSYPLNSGNSSEGHYVVDATGRKVFISTPMNYEYPGNAHVLTAPAINGFDMSAWAQVKSGEHRIVFVARPKNNIPFPELSREIRSTILVDTVVNFTEGEVYTLQIVCRDVDKNQFGLYMRRETFVHQAFEENKNYIGFVNLSGARPKRAQDGYMRVFPEKISINYSFYTHQKAPVKGYYPIEGYNNNFYKTLEKRMDTSISYLTVPLLPREAFFDNDTLRNYYRVDIASTIKPPPTMPFVQFIFGNADNPGSGAKDYGFDCQANGALFNTYRYGLFETVMPSVNKIVSTGNKYRIYSTVNIMEIVYNRVYMMQILRGFNEVPQ